MSQESGVGSKKRLVRDDCRRLPDALWTKMEPLLPPRPKHPLGCHIFGNRLLWASLAGVLALQVAAVHWPPLAAIFGTVPLRAADWTMATAIACSVLLLEEPRKLLQSRVSPAAPAA